MERNFQHIDRNGLSMDWSTSSVVKTVFSQRLFTSFFVVSIDDPKPYEICTSRIGGVSGSELWKDLVGSITDGFEILQGIGLLNYFRPFDLLYLATLIVSL